MSITQSHESAELVTKTEAMDRLKVSLSTVDRLIRVGRLDAVRLTPRTTRITRASLEALAAGAEVAS